MTEEQNGTRGTILIIDDDKVILEPHVDRPQEPRVHRIYGFGCQGRACGCWKRTAQLVLLDYMMPVIDGLSALREVPGTATEKSTRNLLIMFTGKGNEEIAVELMKSGASDYILKPFNNQDLVERIETVLRIREMELRNASCSVNGNPCWRRSLSGTGNWRRECWRSQKPSSGPRRRLCSRKSWLLSGTCRPAWHTRSGTRSISINLFAQLLKAGIDDPEKQGYLDKILKEVDRIDDIMPEAA